MVYTALGNTVHLVQRLDPIINPETNKKQMENEEKYIYPFIPLVSSLALVTKWLLILSQVSNL